VPRFIDIEKKHEVKQLQMTQIPQETQIMFQPDAPVTVVSARLGFFGFSRDFGIWENLRPNTGDEQKQAIWMWFNKSTWGPNNVKVDIWTRYGFRERFFAPDLPRQKNYRRISSSFAPTD
jgi:hypothetical protein